MTAARTPDRTSIFPTHPPRVAFRGASAPEQTIPTIGKVAVKRRRSMRYVSISTLTASVYVLSGIAQPLLITACQKAGLADATAQLYMLFYYAGPSLLLFQLFSSKRREDHDHDHELEGATKPALAVILKACWIALLDVVAQSLNYAGAGMTGATIFAVIYSSVTVWTAIYARFLLGRRLTKRQWIAVAIVVLGLCLTAGSSASLGRSTIIGTILTLVGSSLHGGTYVMSEFIMKRLDQNHGDESPPSAKASSSVPVGRHHLLPHENSAIQAVVAFSGSLLWQIFYTAPRWQELILRPMHANGTTIVRAWTLLLAFGGANLFHSYAFYFTLAHYLGGSTSAGVLKGLQAALVFVAAHWFYCSTDSPGMCFSLPKLFSLVVVTSGVVLYSTDKPRPAATGTDFVPKRSYGALSTTTNGNASAQTT